MLRLELKLEGQILEGQHNVPQCLWRTPASPNKGVNHQVLLIERDQYRATFFASYYSITSNESLAV